MSDVTNSTNSQVYNIQDDGNLIGQVARVILVLMPRAFVAAGFDANGTLLTASSSDYGKTHTPWILDFFEHQFIHNPLVSNTKKVVAVFVANEQNMLVPAPLFDETAAATWLKSMYFIENSETVSSYSLQSDNAYYVGAWPAAIKSLVGRYLPGRKVLPIDYYQFKRQSTAGDRIECCIIRDEASATLYKGGKLQWHQSFRYETPEDIAYHLNLALKLHNLERENVLLQTAAGGPDITETINYLTQYFPKLKEGDSSIPGNRNWMATVYLLQQLYTCAL
ncbi:MAG: DUF3822 family protein [Sphingobacteriales bacterium]|nr:MAG: DUF3822 family protein [Sphingobacteriales bacterium]